jgi:UDP-N-acetylglucosamine 1-carboxyvinyltransferase
MGWTSELSKFGAHTVLADPHRLITFGGLPLTPARVESPYIIRVAIALMMVAASIDGRSEIRNAAPIRRAHPNFVENLRLLGADIEWSPPLPPVVGEPANDPAPGATPSLAAA